MHHPVFDCSFQKWMVRKPGFYHMIDVSVYLSRQRGEMSLVEKTHFTKPFFILNQECVMNVMIVHALLCNLFLYKLFMHSCVVAESTFCMLSSVLLSFLSRINPLESTSTQSQNITEWYFFFLLHRRSKLERLVQKLQEQFKLVFCFIRISFPPRST